MLTMQVMACMGIIIGLFLLLGINLTDFTGNILKRLLSGPKPMILSRRSFRD